MFKKNGVLCLVTSVLILFSIQVYAHKGETHEKSESSDKMKSEVMDKVKESPFSKETLEAINKAYQSSVKPIFRGKCLDCHGTWKKAPWYYKLPVVKQLIDKDIQEAKEHIDMTSDYPFGGHGNPESNLAAIKKSLEEVTMPPLRYRLMNPFSTLTDEEREIVDKWIKTARQLLKNDMN